MMRIYRFYASEEQGCGFESRRHSKSQHFCVVAKPLVQNIVLFRRKVECIKKKVIVWYDMMM